MNSLPIPCPGCVHVMSPDEVVRSLRDLTTEIRRMRLELNLACQLLATERRVVRRRARNAAILSAMSSASLASIGCIAAHTPGPFTAGTALLAAVGASMAVWVLFEHDRWCENLSLPHFGWIRR